MKTQIDNLINGSKNVVRDENHPKYATAKKNTYGDGYVGTSTAERLAIAEKVFAENGDEMHVIIRGVEITLRRHFSTTGKTSWYSSELTSDEYTTICSGRVYEFPAEMKFKSFGITIHNDCTVTTVRYGKKSEGGAWKVREYSDIDEAFVTIKE